MCGTCRLGTVARRVTSYVPDMLRHALTVALLALPLQLFAAQVQKSRPASTTRVREYVQSFPTYPFDDPNPIPVLGRIYPYFRFDGFHTTGEPRNWKVVELENEYVRVLILPEIGGKIWTAIEKRSGRPFIYYNRVVKFRDIAMRGPWTSGGIEANYGILGHTPNVSTPVDYTVRRNVDGSVSAITGALDLLTGTTWRLETRLAPGEASFTTTSTWYNGSSLEQPYYTWMTAAIPTTGALQYVVPGHRSIGHDGEPGAWPISRARDRSAGGPRDGVVRDTSERDVSWYDQNDFGGYKSYHVVGAAGDFSGAYWHAQDFGLARVAPRDEKPGQKIWIWGLSRQGMIWEELLTDRDGQYSELQSGRLFNQSAEGSTLTPFKHRGFTPQLVDRWTERWMPVVGTKGFVVASDVGALNVTRDGDRIIVALSPAITIDDTLVVKSANRTLYARPVRRSPLQPFVDTIAAPGVALTTVTVALGADRLVFYGDTTETTLDRPIESPLGFDWSSATALHLKGKELMRQREYDRAVVLLDSALVRAPHLVPALVDRSAMALRSMQYDSARLFARSALAVDSYDGGANYYYGLANRHLGRFADARDGFEIASQSMEYRAAAWTELARLWLARGDADRADSYATKVLAIQPGTLDALGVRIVTARRRANVPATTNAIAALERADPLSHQARFERLLASRVTDAGARLRNGVRSELPEQQLFALAAWYQDVGEFSVAARVLEAIGEHPEALYWRAALRANATDDARRDRAPRDHDAGAQPIVDALALIDRANALSPRMVFPFRPQVIEALEQAARASSHWMPRYYLALGLWGTGRVVRATALFTELRDVPTYAPFYSARASLPGRSLSAQIADLERAVALDSTEWRVGKLLAERRLAAGDTTRALAVARTYFTRSPRSYILGMTLARMQLAAARYAEADSLLTTLTVLPYEGAADGRVLFREAKLMLAVDAIAARRWDEATRLIAAAREWPERLGAGKPYDADLDERLEDWLLADVRVRSGFAAEVEATRARLAGWFAERSTSQARAGLERRVLSRWLQLPR